MPVFLVNEGGAEQSGYVAFITEQSGYAAFVSDKIVQELREQFPGG